MHFFNTAGPVNALDHYCIDPLRRFDLSVILKLIEQKKYFVLHAPRQSGKTSCMLALTDYINQKDQYKCLYINLESSYTAADDITESMKCILSELSSRARDYLNDYLPEKIAFNLLEERGPNLAFNELLTQWSKNSLKPIILIFDEVDSLQGKILAALLRQLRAGYDKRPRLFPQSAILCCVEDIRYKKIELSPGNVVTGGSIFNIEAKSLRLNNFSKDDIESLFHRYSKDTQIKVDMAAINKIWRLTAGQPWIVNALGYEICSEMVPRKKDISTIKERDVDEAAENIIQKQEIHLQNLVEQLNQEGVKKIISPMLTGEEFFQDISEEDFQYLYDLGLITISSSQIGIANEIYKEIIPRSLIYSTQLLIRYDLDLFSEEDGMLNMRKIIKSFQNFYNKYFRRWAERFSYQQAGAFLFFQAFLQRIIDGGGKIQREYGIGRKFTTLTISWPYRQSIQKNLIDLHFFKPPLKEQMRKSVEELTVQMKERKISDGYVIIFSKNPDELWEQKIYKNNKEDGLIIDVWLI
ncbi:MAG: ATP-binding protein [Spirochaetales bacterium]|nr:ATP-binding protein [Spirochaetales bacterium]